MKITGSTLRTLAVHGALAAAACAQLHPAVTEWMVNRDGARGRSTDPRVHAVLSQIPANVARVSYTSTDAYVEASGIPSYAIGPWRNPNMPSDQRFVMRIPFAPQKATTHMPTNLGVIGLHVNGVALFNALDARSYRNLGIWNQNAVVAEARGFDQALGHPQQRGIYHHHQQPPSLRAQLCDHGRDHSPLLGFAYDGFPIYGPYGFANPNGSGGIKRIASSYRERNITQRTSLPNGRPLQPSEYGPPIGAQFPLGYYAEDHEFVRGLGDLDEFNGRFAVTPEYPNGTYAYYATIDAAGDSAYPYAVGPQYYGTLLNDNRRQRVTIPPGARVYSGGGAECFGAGCPANAPLLLGYTGTGSVGDSITVRLHGGPSSGPGGIGFGGTASAPYPIDLTPLGAPGCFQRASADLILGVAFQSGSASLLVPIPNDPGLAGAIVYQQGIAVDRAANALGITTSNGGKLTVRP